MTQRGDSEYVRRIEHGGTAARGGAPRLTVLVIGTLDTKALEISAVADEIEKLGSDVILLDTSGRAHATRDSVALARGRTVISHAEVAAAAGTSREKVSELGRGEAALVLRRGVLVRTKALHDEGHIQAALCVGGAGAYIAKDAFAALPIGFPKLIVSPLASGSRTFEAYVGTRDVAVMHSVADIVGLNDVTSAVYRTAAGYIVGAARATVASSPETSPEGARASVAVSMNGNTTDNLMALKADLEEAGYGVVAFHANGVGGRALEEYVAEREVAAVLDYTTTELAGHHIGGLMDAGPSRMETAGRLGVPQVLVPGCLDFITSGDPESTARTFPGRNTFMHNPELTLVRLTATEMREMGVIFGRKANQSTGPTTVCIPLRGFSVQDAEGKLFWDPDADQAFLNALEQTLSPSVRLVRIPHHINDREFADAVREELLNLLAGSTSAARAQVLPDAPSHANVGGVT